MQLATSFKEPYQVLQVNRSRLSLWLVRCVDQLRAGAAAIPPSGFVLLSSLAIQTGMAFSKQLFTQLGPTGVVCIKTVFAALLLLVIWRPRLKNYERRDYALILLSGLVTAGLNLSFYEAIARIPLGVASTLLFIGPLGIAVAGSRRLSDLVWVVLATAGVILLTPSNSRVLDPLGVVLALLAGGC